MKIRKKYDSAFKERAVQLSKDQKKLSDPARELSRYQTQIYKWRREEEKFVTGSFPGNENLKQTPEQQGNCRLEKKLKT